MNNKYFCELANAIDGTTVSGTDERLFLYNDGLEVLINKIRDCKAMNARLFFIGNGGSAAIASHMTADFLKNGGMQTCSLYDRAVMTCIGNDYGYEHIFAKPLSKLGRSGDLLVAISSSGNSPNIVRAIETAREKEIFVITFTGFKPDNKARQLGNINVYVPCEEYGKVESIHQLILQQIVDMILERDGLKL
ncbi:MAG: SIS domain-containing protein [Selenomonas ruminantium]|uniref:SIS domain-containing protein n=1 Tax=Selenomonas ruminantium TaxID=971 RepID=A0A927WNJ9_SELRU|nr:SIS domain-containing protein [Selenomonas ruminantium]